MRSHPLVHSFVTPANKNNALQLRKAPRSFLVKKFTGRGKQHDGGASLRRGGLCGIANTTPKELFHRLKDRRRLQHHAFAPAKRPVVNRAMSVFGELA